MTATTTRLVRDIITAKGWLPGSDLEDRACRFLSGVFAPDGVKQQHRVGRYRLDFAWLDVMVALEIDGPRHLWDPAAALRDAQRDAYVRSQGWLVFRVDDSAGGRGMEEQIARVGRTVKQMQSWL